MPYIYICLLFVRAWFVNICKFQYSWLAPNRTIAQKSTHTVCLAQDLASSNSCKTLHLWRVQTLHTWTCVRRTGDPQCPWHGENTTARKEPSLLWKHQVLYLYELARVSNLLNSLAREEAEDKDMSPLCTALTPSYAWKLQNLGTECRLWIGTVQK